MRSRTALKLSLRNFIHGRTRTSRSNRAYFIETQICLMNFTRWFAHGANGCWWNGGTFQIRVKLALYYELPRYFSDYESYMISHLLGNPQGPSLSLGFFSCGPDDGVVPVCLGAASVDAPFAPVFDVFSVFVLPFTASFCWPSSHG